MAAGSIPPEVSDLAGSLGLDPSLLHFFFAEHIVRAHLNLDRSILLQLLTWL